MENQNEQQSSPFLGYVILVIIGVIILGIVYKCNGKNNEPKAKTEKVYGNTNSDKILAFNLATNKLEKLLKSPSSAEFPSIREKVSHVSFIGNGKYQINSWVDATNSFGATVRTNWSAEVEIKGESVYVRNVQTY